MSLERFIPTISIERLKSFSFTENSYDENLLIKRYEFNIKLSQAFYPILSMFEVTLRNSIDTMLQCVISPNWLENEINNQTILFDNDYRKLIKANNKLLCKYKKGNVTRGKIISELTLGFWVSLCSKKYNPRIWTKKGAFRGVFVNYPQGKREQIHELSQKLTRINNFRNRVFHYEPIYNKNTQFCQLYDEINEVISFLPKDDSNILKNTDNFLVTIAVIIKDLDDLVKQIEDRLNSKKP